MQLAERRMFAKTIVLSDAFLDMPMSARCLYFTLGMLADDDGFVNSPKSVMRQVGASMDDMNILLAKKFLLDFDSGVIVIKHWRINNYLRNDRYTETKYIDEKCCLAVDANGSYTTQVIPTIAEVSETRHKYGMYKNVLLTDEDYAKLQEEFPHDYTERIDNLSEYIESSGKKYKSHLATIRAWARKDKGKQSTQKGTSSNPFLEMLEEEQYE